MSAQMAEFPRQSARVCKIRKGAITEFTYVCRCRAEERSQWYDPRNVKPDAGMESRSVRCFI
jgi:hypothetical protein